MFGFFRSHSSPQNDGSGGCSCSKQLLNHYTLLIESVLNERHRKSEDVYSALDPLSSEFLTQDRGNFRLLSSQIQSIVFVPQWRFYSSKPLPNWNMEISETNGAVRRFSRSSADPLEDVLEKVRALGVRVESAP